MILKLKFNNMICTETGESCKACHLLYDDDNYSLYDMDDSSEYEFLRDNCEIDNFLRKCDEDDLGCHWAENTKCTICEEIKSFTYIDTYSCVFECKTKSNKKIVVRMLDIIDLIIDDVVYIKDSEIIKEV